MADTSVQSAPEAPRRPAPQAGPVLAPEVDVVETADAFVVTADLPGVDREGIQVGLEDGVLTLDAAVSAAAPDPGWRLAHAEYRPGSFHRRFHLSDRIDVGGISAQMRDGVLTLRLPKTERHRPRRIEVAS
jgi:HSP20 family molecular chaperone IbpA